MYGREHGYVICQWLQVCDMYLNSSVVRGPNELEDPSRIAAINALLRSNICKQVLRKQVFPKFAKPGFSRSGDGACVKLDHCFVV
jgi:hypothetical protein